MAPESEAPPYGVPSRPEATAWYPPPRSAWSWETQAGMKHDAVYDFPAGPIRWVNVWYTPGSGGQGGSGPRYYYYYGVPDPRVADIRHELQIESVRKKAFPLVWRVVDVSWQGWDGRLGIIHHLNSNLGLVDPTMKSFDVSITPHLRTSCWLIDGTKGFRSSWRRESPLIPMTGPRWNWLDAIARNLLAWRPSTE